MAPPAPLLLNLQLRLPPLLGGARASVLGRCRSRWVPAAPLPRRATGIVSTITPPMGRRQRRVVHSAATLRNPPK